MSRTQSHQIFELITYSRLLEIVTRPLGSQFYLRLLQTFMMDSQENFKDVWCHEAQFHQLLELAIFPELSEPVVELIGRWLILLYITEDLSYQFCMKFWQFLQFYHMFELVTFSGIPKPVMELLGGHCYWRYLRWILYVLPYGSVLSN